VIHDRFVASPRSIRRTAFLVGLVGAGLYAVSGCNSVLDNKPGQLDERRTTVEPSQPPASTPPPGNTNPVTPTTPPTPDLDAGITPPADGGGCGADQQLCHGFCVSIVDPNYGCGDPACTPCRIPHGVATCQDRACVVKACDPGYSDCNTNPTDGCEGDLSKATTCGTCNAVCGAAAPVCAPAGGSFGCSTGCTAEAPLLCGAECVSPLTSVNHCGACNQKCPDIDQGTSACTAGVCTFTCKPGYHSCGGRCVLTTDPASCGATCTPCPVPANAVATCAAEACGIQCNPGFADCNATPGDGCEAVLASDPLNCGGCGISCNGGTCNAGACTPAPDGGP
jgi:hypothetical protein